LKAKSFIGDRQTGASVRQTLKSEARRLLREHAVHHKEPHKGDPKLFWNKSLWQPLCELCHNRWARQVETCGYHSNVGADGLPIDPRHPFNRVSARINDADAPLRGSP
jgi:hypothetical protein